MEREPDFELICELIDASYVDTAMKQLDKLLTIYAKAGEADMMLDMLEILHLNYLDIEPIGYRLMLLRKRLGLDDYQDDFFDN